MNLQETIELGKREIQNDIDAGTVPPTVQSFSELHDYVDANYYGGAFEQPFDGSDEACHFWNQVQTALDEWIKKGRPS